MKIMINGESSEVEAGTTIQSLLERLEIPLAGTAVALGDSIVPQSEHGTRVLGDGDRVEVIRAIGGG